MGRLSVFRTFDKLYRRVHCFPSPVHTLSIISVTKTPVLDSLKRVNNYISKGTRVLFLHTNSLSEGSKRNLLSP